MEVTEYVDTLHRLAEDVKFVSLFAGIGGFDLGFENVGMECVAQVEIDKAAQAILRRHFPEAELYEDVKTYTPHGAVDLICGGFPCQDVSIAGRRAGLAGERSGLWYEFHRIIAAARPGWVVIENVPGLLSSNGGRDFAAIVHGLAECGYGVAWRVLDAQYFGVAQRRRRVFIVGHLGDGRAAEVLFERESLPGDTPPSRKAGQGVAGSLDRKSASSNRGSQANEAEFVVAGTLPADYYKQGGNGMGEMENGTIPIYVQEIADPLTVRMAQHCGASAGNDCYPHNHISVRMAQTSSNGWGIVEDGTVHTLDGGGGDAIAWHGAQITSPQNCGGVFEGVTPTLNGDARSMVGVRRLTPTECERLQGFPDGYTAGQADSARYRQLGNAVAVPVVEWIGRRIVML